MCSSVKACPAIDSRTLIYPNNFLSSINLFTAFLRGKWLHSEHFRVGFVLLLFCEASTFCLPSVSHFVGHLFASRPDVRPAVSTGDFALKLDVLLFSQKDNKAHEAPYNDGDITPFGGSSAFSGFRS